MPNPRVEVSGLKPRDDFTHGRVANVEVKHDLEAVTSDLEDTGLCKAVGDKLKIIASQRMFGIQKYLKLSVGGLGTLELKT